MNGSENEQRGEIKIRNAWIDDLGEIVTVHRV